MGQLVATWKLRRGGRSNIAMNTDVGNAFGSTKHETLDESAELLYLDEDLKWAEQRFRWACAGIPCDKGKVLLRIRIGALMGDQWAVMSFVPSSEAPTSRWNSGHIAILGPVDALA